MGNANVLKEYAWINMGSQRKEVMGFLPDKPFTAENLRKKINEKISLKLSLREMSRHLKSFIERGILTCLNSSAPYNRLHVLTKKGKDLKESVESNKFS